MCRKCTNKVYKHDPLKAHLNAVRHKAKKARIPFDLTADDLTIPELCPVIGIPLHRTWGAVKRAGIKDNSASIDRLIPSD